MLLPPNGPSNGTLIRFGAGVSADVEALLRGPGAPARVILIEPNPDHIKALTNRLGTYPQVTVLGVAAGPADLTSSDAMLMVFSDPGHASLHRHLPVLNQLLPGLRQTGAIAVTVQPAGQILERLGDVPHPIHLELDAPGSEQEILSALHEAGHLDRLDSIDLRAGAEPLYEGAGSAATLKVWLERHDFRLSVEATDDPDWPELRLIADPAARALRQKVLDLTTLTATQQDRIADLEREAAAYQSAAAERRAEVQTRNARIAALEGELTDLLQASERQAKRVGELEQDRDSTHERAQDLERRAAAREDALSDLESRFNALREQSAADRDTAQARIQDIEKALANATGEASATALHVKEMADRDEVRAARLAATERDLAAAKSALAESHSSQSATAKALANSEAERQELADQLRAKDDKLAGLDRDLVAARRGQDEKTARLADTEAALAASEAAATSAQADRKSAEARIEAISALAAQRLSKLTGLETALEAAAKVSAVTEARQKDLAERVRAAEGKLAAHDRDLTLARHSLQEKSASLTEVETALAAAQAAAAAAIADSAAAEARIDVASSTAAERLLKLTETEKALSRATAEARSAATALQEMQTLADGLRGDLVKLQAQELEREQAATDQAATLSNVTTDLARSDQKATGLQAAVAERDGKLKTSGDRLAAQDRTVADLRGQIRILNEDAQRSAAEVQAARQDLGTSLRLQNRLRADLGDLQDRFASLQEVRREQDDLLRQLTPRLRQAAQQLQSLKLMELPSDARPTEPPAGSKKAARRSKKLKV